MTQRKHKTSNVKCGGCGREFGIIQHSHIVRCPALSMLGVTNRAQYTLRFGSTMNTEALKASAATISKFNAGLSNEERTEHAKNARKAALATIPNLSSMGGVLGAKALWAKEGQRGRHASRLVQLNANGFMAQQPNKLEQKFWDLIGADKISFCSFSFWKTIAGERGVTHITPDFRVVGTPVVIEVYGDYWHQGEDPAVRISQWAAVGMECLVVWEHEINKNPEATKLIVEAFISRNFHERATPTLNQVG